MVFVAMYSFSAYGVTFSEVTAEAKRILAEAKIELSDLQQAIAREKIPLSEHLTSLEAEMLSLTKIRNADEAISSGKISGTRTYKENIGTLTDDYMDLKARMAYYIERFTENLSSVEYYIYKEQTDAAEQLGKDKNAIPVEVLSAQLEVIRTSLERLKNVIGAARIKGLASVNEKNTVTGEYVLVGPLVFFSDGIGEIGIAQNDTNKAYPVIFDKGFSKDELLEINRVASTGNGLLPIDSTGGNAILVILANDGFVEHIVKGGITMIPLIGMFFLAVFVAVFKFFEIKSVRIPAEGTVEAILDKLELSKLEEAREMANSVDGPFGDLLLTGVNNADQPKEVLEEALYERLLAAQPKFERFLSFLALSAAASPLLGLLGTVTGMIQTFSMINQYGTGDPAVLSDGISVALITTQYGLIVAIPCLAAQVLLSRVAKGKLAKMESVAAAFSNSCMKGTSEI